MKRYSCGVARIAFMLASAVLVFSTTTVRAGDGSTGGFYLATDAGVNLADKLVSDSLFGLSGGSVSLSPGVRWNLSAGYAFKLSDHLALAPELEVGYVYNSFDKGSVGGQNTSGGGSLSQVPLLANAALSWEINPRWSAYGGLGLGVEYFDVSVSNGSILSGMATSAGAVAWQAMAGVRYKLGPGEVGLGYKYLGMAPFFFHNLGNNAVMVSYTYRF